MPHNRLQFVKKTQISDTSLWAKLHEDHKILFYYFQLANYGKNLKETFKYCRASWLFGAFALWLYN